MASSALSSLFHMCGEEEKKRLIDHMMGMFTDGTTSKHHHKPKITSGVEGAFLQYAITITLNILNLIKYQSLQSF